MQSLLTILYSHSVLYSYGIAIFWRMSSDPATLHLRDFSARKYKTLAFCSEHLEPNSDACKSIERML